MHYCDGALAALGDLVDVEIPAGIAEARMVMLGETYEHLDLDPSFIDWVTAEDILAPTSVVVEWVERILFAHSDPRLAPVGNEMFLELDEHVLRRA